MASFAIFVIGFAIVFLAITLTIILGAVSRRSDKRVELEGRATTAQRPPTEREARSY